MFKKTLRCLAVVGALFFHLLFMPTAVAGVTVPETHCIYKGCDDPAPSQSTPSYNRNREDDEATQRENEKIRRYNAIIDQVRAAWKRDDYREVLRLLREQQKLIDGPNVRAAITEYENILLAKDYIQQADDAHAKGDSKQALELYKKALAKILNPSPGYRKFVADYERDVARQDKIAKTLDHLADSIKDDRPAPSTAGLEFMAATSPKSTAANAGSQLKSAELHGRIAQRMDKESSKEESGKVFDTAKGVINSGTLVYPDRNQAPPSALDKQIPRGAQGDPQVMQMQAWYRSLDAQKAEKEKKIAEIKEQQKTSKDPLLDVKITTLTNDIKSLTDDQAKAAEAVHKQVEVLKKQTIDKGLKWDEEPATDNPSAKK